MFQDFDSLSDEELMTIFQDGQSDALSYLLKRCRPRMDQVVRSKILDRELANDALQEACILICKNAKDFRGESKVFTWMYRLIINTCIDILRKEKTRSSLNVEDDVLFTVADESSDFEDSMNTQISVKEALMKLPPDQREALRHVWIEGFTVEETSVMLSIPLGTVKSRCDRGKKALAELLRDLDPGKEPRAISTRLRKGGKK